MTDSLADTCRHLAPNENPAHGVLHLTRVWKDNYTKANVIVVFVVGHREGRQNSWVFDLFSFFICIQLHKSTSKGSRVWSSSLRFCDGDQQINRQKDTHRKVILQMKWLLLVLLGISCTPRAAKQREVISLIWFPRGVQNKLHLMTSFKKKIIKMQGCHQCLWNTCFESLCLRVWTSGQCPGFSWNGTDEREGKAGLANWKVGALCKHYYMKCERCNVSETRQGLV